MSFNTNNFIRRTQNNGIGEFTTIVTDLLQSNGVAMNDFVSVPFDIVEENNYIKVYGYLPGVDCSSLTVDFYNNVLEIKGKRIKPYSNDSVKFREEIIYGDFHKKIDLPICITSHDSVISSKTENGVLELVIDKNKEERNRFRVQVESAVSQNDENVQSASTYDNDDLSPSPHF
jgi:HSP20 family molecular chaperone IbpA|uniref:SHSP domain-containing protein n=1 Tax=viral metagenome TaxID=1070528 RepID=A0A6C0IZA8_9ZZZZ